MQEKQTAQKTVVYQETDGTYTEAVVPFSLNDVYLTRLFIMNSGTVYYGLTSKGANITAGYEQGFTYVVGSTSYDIATLTYPVTTGTLANSVTAGTSFDILSEISLPESDYQSITFNGSIDVGLLGNKSLSYANYRMYPTSAQIIINDTVVSETVSRVNNEFTFDNVTVDITEDVYAIGYRFTYDNAQSYTLANSFSISHSDLVLYIDDSTSAVLTEKEETPVYIPILTEIKDFLSDIYGAIVGLFTPDSGVIEDSNQFVDDMTIVTDKIKEDVSEIEENTNRPPPEDLVPDITVIVDQSDENYISYMDGMSSLLASSTITNILLLMFSLAFCGYVLFGKKE